jgi:hypothetical protein
MKKNYLIIVAAFLLLIGLNAYFIRNYYKTQISHQRNLLYQETEVCSNEIERVVQRFESDLNYILFSDDITNLFSKENSESLRKLQLFYSTYNNLIKNIDIYDNNRNVFNLYRDTKKNFITDSYLAQRQRDLSVKEEILMQNSEYQYVLPVYKDNQLFANTLVTINLKNYFLSELDKFYLEGYTWQWVFDLDNKEIFNSGHFKFTKIEKSDDIFQNLSKDLEGLTIQTISNDSLHYKLLTVYSPIKVIDRKFGVAMSIDYHKFMHQIFSDLMTVVLISFIIFILISLYFVLEIRNLKKKIKA